MLPEAREVKRWLEKADHDHAGAEVALERNPPVTDVAAFHCQQAVEKLLKGYLVYRAQLFERTHDLVELLALCMQSDASFEELRSRVEPLTPYAVRFRYPGPADPPLDDVKTALEVVQIVRRFVLSRLPEEVGP